MSEEKYFKDRMNIENKHYLFVAQWVDFFDPENVLDCGCGAGHLVKAFQDSDVTSCGFDISEYVIKNSPHLDIKENLEVANILNYKDCKDYDLVIAFDCLEHLNNIEEVERAINNLKSWSRKYILISVPVIGDPNLEADLTHKIKLTNQEWENIFLKQGLKKIQTPEYFYFGEQIFIYEV